MQDSINDGANLSVNPATGETLSVWPVADPARIEQCLQLARATATSWRRTAPERRAEVLLGMARALRANQAGLARMITLEMGKPITEAMAEVEKSAWNCEYVGQQGVAWLQDEKVATQAADSRVVFEPLGVVLSILPWNFPVWQAVRCAAAALMAGNTILLKHAPNVQGCANLLAEVLEEAGLPHGAFINLNAPVASIAAIIADPRIAAVALTGSPAAGAKVAAQAGAACKKTVLELGGSDAFIVLADADLDAAVAGAVRARFTNCGQVCLAAKRLIVDATVADDFAAAFVAATEKLRRGDPLLEHTQLGPLARADLREGIEKQVQASLDAGATLLTGGHRPDAAGWFYEPTVLANLTAKMPVVAEETFGPVAALITARSADEAIRMANDSDFGLSAMLWTRDVERAGQLARELEVGSVFINSVTASDPRIPVGGVKLSGYGRELGRAGMLEFCNLKTVWRA